jgi:predicted phosphoribosyltransferase
MKLFYNRTEAGLALAQQLKPLPRSNSVVLAIPRGGVPVAAVVAQELKLPLQVWLCKKIGHPHQKEYAIGAVTLTDAWLIPHEEIEEEYLASEIKAVRHRLQEMQQRFGVADAASLKGKTAILVDDGIATGNTLMAAVRLLRQSEPARIVIAVPVASRQAQELLAPEVDEFICLHSPAFFTGVGAFYEHFEQVSDEEVMALLQPAAGQ